MLSTPKTTGPLASAASGALANGTKILGNRVSAAAAAQGNAPLTGRSVPSKATSPMKTLLEKYTGLTLDDGAPEDWIHIDSTAAGGYVLKVTITGKNGVKQITGRNIRENILSYRIKSHAFTLTYANGIFTFTTNGYGHGVGMSQTGANGYAVNDGWSYRQILEHYYPSTSVY